MTVPIVKALENRSKKCETLIERDYKLIIFGLRNT